MLRKIEDARKTGTVTPASDTPTAAGTTGQTSASPAKAEDNSANDQKYQEAMNKGQGYLDKNKYDNALSEFKKALNLKPGDDDAQNKIDEINRNYKEFNNPNVANPSISDPVIKRVTIINGVSTKVTLLFKNYKGSGIQVFSPVKYPNYAFYIKANNSEYLIKDVENVEFQSTFEIPSDNFEINLIFDDIPISTKNIDLIEGKKELQNQQPWKFIGISLK
jgi:tetratricopeptide (TPR) repeat protein